MQPHHRLEFHQHPPRQSRHSLNASTSSTSTFFARIRHSRNNSSVSAKDTTGLSSPPPSSPLHHLTLKHAAPESRKWWKRKPFRGAQARETSKHTRSDDNRYDFHHSHPYPPRRRQHRKDSVGSWAGSPSTTASSSSGSARTSRKLVRRNGHRPYSLPTNPNFHWTHEDDGPRIMAFDEDEKEFASSTDLTDLPADGSSILNAEDSSFTAATKDPHPHSEGAHSFDEHQMNAHLADVESSFLPEANMSAVNVERLGADDTYLELGAATHARDAPHEVENRGLSEDAKGSDLYVAGHEEEADNSLSSVTSSSSPSAAAAQRTQSRNVSAVSAIKVDPAHSFASSNEQQSTTPDSKRPTSQGSTVRIASSPQPEPSRKASLLSLGRSGSKLSSRRGVRPHSNRHPSQSTISSMSGSEGVPDIDHVFQTGGSILTRGSSRSTLLSRLPSLGSMASFMTGEEAGSPYHARDGASTREVHTNGTTTAAHDEDERPVTPRANPSRFTAPTDTVIAKHVQSIQVPDTVARDFRARNRSMSPEKRPASSAGFASSIQERPRRTLTLKEQNSKVDKLSKENFDLKLKIHFLDQALQNRSDDGVKELINQNVQFQTDLANERKELHALRRKMKEMEKKIKDQEVALAEAAEHARRARIDDDEDPTLQAEMHQEILYLRQQLDYSENKISTLREDLLTKDFEKRKMSETMRNMAGKRGEDSAGMRETMDMWQDLLNAEVSRREQAEEDAGKLREEINALRLERVSTGMTRNGKVAKGLAHDDDDDIFNDAHELNESNALVEQLKHENAELRRDLGAQTSMLTSRNRERERLQQEIEDLKLLHRKGDGARSVAGESIFDRSISRAHQRASSRHSEVTGFTPVTEAERDDWDKKEGQLRDQNAELRIKFQELERTHNKHIEYVTVLEGDYQEMEQELNEVHEDLVKLQSERDEALQAYDEREAEYQQLREEALAEIQALDEDKKILEAQLEEALAKAQKTHVKLQSTSDGYKGLQGELREITQSVMNLEDEKQANMRTIQNLELQIAEAEDEIQKWEQKCSELDQKNRKLEITQESLHSEVTFLREEQEGDKIKIGELQDSLSNAQQTVADEQERLREMEHAMLDERQQRDVLENQSKEEVQKVLDGLNADNAKSKDQIRHLRRQLSAKEVEANSWRQKLEEFEQSLREVLGDREGTKQSLLGEIEKLQRDLEATATDLDRAKMDLADKDRLLRHRDGLLESTSLESRRLSDLLDKERSARKHDLDSFEKASRGSASHIRTIAQQESRMMELETSFGQQQRKMASLEEQYREHVHERNTLLLALWNRLSTLCGSEWAQKHSLLNGEIPSPESINKHLPVFHKNVIAAIKQTEKIVGDFKIRIRRFEKEVLSDYQTLNNNLNLRLRRLDAVERAVENHKYTIAEDAAQRAQLARQPSNRLVKANADELNKLKAEIKLLKAELKFHRQHPSAMAQQMLNQQMQLHPPPDNTRRTSSSAGSGGSHQKRDSISAASPARQIVNTIFRHASSSASRPASAIMAPPDDYLQQQQTPAIPLDPPTVGPTEQRWAHRLQEMERRLKAEREARLLDRQGARQRLQEAGLENEQLRGRLEREISRRTLTDTESVAASGGEIELQEDRSEHALSSSGEDVRDTDGTGVELQ